MAQKRMFDKTITNSDDFLELPDSSQILYFHLNMNADDDGFINNWKSILRMTGTKEDDLKLLIAKSFVIPFETGVIVIKHWRINNYLRNDRYKQTTHKMELSLLEVGENGEYLLSNNDIGIPMVYPDKNRIEKNSIDKNSIDNIYIVEQDSTALVTKNVISYLNSKLGTKYKPTTPKTKQLVKARINEGFTESDFMQVIDTMVREWGNDSKMNIYLRPETLFSNRFESYLNRKPKELTTKDLQDKIDFSDF